MGLLIIGIIVGLLGLLIMFSDSEGIGPGALTLCLCAVMIAGSLVSDGKKVSSSIVETDMLVAVNGYYLDPSGAYVTASNRRGTMGGIPAIRESAVKNPPFILVEKTIYKKNFWALHNSTGLSYKLSFEDLPLVR